MAAVKAAAVLAIAALSIAPSAAANLAKAVLIAGDFASPVYVTSPPGEAHLLFVVEQTGRIQLLEDEVRQPIPFLDIHNRVSVSQERGLFSMAFAPDYATSRRFY